MALIELHHTMTRLTIMGRSFRLVAVATTDQEANDYMAKNTGAAVLHCVKDGVIYLADKHDKGLPA